MKDVFFQKVRLGSISCWVRNDRYNCHYNRGPYHAGFGMTGTTVTTTGVHIMLGSEWQVQLSLQQGSISSWVRNDRYNCHYNRGPYHPGFGMTGTTVTTTGVHIMLGSEWQVQLSLQQGSISCWVRNDRYNCHYNRGPYHAGFGMTGTTVTTTGVHIILGSEWQVQLSLQQGPISCWVRNDRYNCHYNRGPYHAGFGMTGTTVTTTGVHIILGSEWQVQLSLQQGSISSWVRNDRYNCHYNRGPYHRGFGMTGTTVTTTGVHIMLGSEWQVQLSLQQGSISSWVRNDRYNCHYNRGPYHAGFGMTGTTVIQQGSISSWVRNDRYNCHYNRGPYHPGFGMTGTTVTTTGVHIILGSEWQVQLSLQQGSISCWVRNDRYNCHYNRGPYHPGFGMTGTTVTTTGSFRELAQYNYE